jgi:hypothetical protein
MDANQIEAEVARLTCRETAVLLALRQGWVILMKSGEKTFFLVGEPEFEARVETPDGALCATGARAIPSTPDQAPRVFRGDLIAYDPDHPLSDADGDVRAYVLTELGRKFGEEAERRFGDVAAKVAREKMEEHLDSRRN